ncbi:phosphatase PAP2 family protein [Luteipulveratus flavus]|uniref:Phosphatase PAP2 family protein n=1 Tax=Luteipulveratus flavus TaxID=3031728 RepID=A0ABT6C9P5_9MICO|nr:phosphatase PAP2 family protein [Luteipulveratus sp. YIM 133296]MDF8265067.1 phosphatase PAP2 family protein [Luteipulveratus sp. YIM 133296]
MSSRTPGRRAARFVVDKAVRPVAARRDWLREHIVVLALLVLGVVLSLGLTASAAQVYESVEDGGHLAGLDQPVLRSAERMRTPANKEAVTWFTDLGGPLWFPVIAGVILLAVALWRRSVEPLVLGAIGLAGGLAMTSVGKAVIGRARPPLRDAVPPYESSPSFPSGHALMATVLAGIVGYLLLRAVLRPWLRALVVALCALWALAMGLSRVFLGHHWLTDVCAGWVLGLGWVAAIVTLHQAWLLTRDADGVEPEVR